MVAAPIGAGTLDDPVFDPTNSDPYSVVNARQIPHREAITAASLRQDRPLARQFRKDLQPSQGATTGRRTRGMRAGTHDGPPAVWALAGVLLISARRPPGTCPASPHVPRHRPKPDRIACSRQYRRGVGPGARCLGVLSVETLVPAGEFGARPFGMLHAVWARNDALCSDATSDAGFCPCSAGPGPRARTLRVADTKDTAPAPRPSGVAARCASLSRVHPDEARRPPRRVLPDVPDDRPARAGPGDSHRRRKAN